MDAASFAPRLVRWQRRFGRSGLPWQGTRDAYRIWVSEIMLQQTQVQTVIPYYRRFLARFPDVNALAGGTLDDVLQLWSGLGYYARARSLHAAARMVANEWSGRFPADTAELVRLPGVGRSTAAAIAVFAHGTHAAILDGNVKRVLSRCFAVRGVPGSSALEKRLWDLAESLLPARDIRAYTQGLMDLGSTVCTRTGPECPQCPFTGACEAERLGTPEKFPGRKPKAELPRRRTVMLIAIHDRRLLLERRAPTGIWGGLWSLPEYPSRAAALSDCERRVGNCIATRRLDTLVHGFSHFQLSITPLVCEVERCVPLASEPGRTWIDIEQAMVSSIPSPVRRLLKAVRGLYAQGLGNSRWRTSTGSVVPK